MESKAEQELREKWAKENGYVKLARYQIFPEMAEFGTRENKIQKDYAEKMYDEGWRIVIEEAK